MVMKFCGLIDLIKGSGVHITITLACLIFELLPFVYFHTCILSGVFIFILAFCLEHISKSILAMDMVFCGWIDLIEGECSAHEP